MMLNTTQIYVWTSARSGGLRRGEALNEAVTEGVGFYYASSPFNGDHPHPPFET